MKMTHVSALLSLVLCCSSPVRGQTFEWIHQLGKSRSDISWGVSADGLGNAYISGSTEGSLRGTGAGAFLTKIDASGTLKWTRQVVTNSRGVSADGLGNVYISGSTRGSLEGTNAGEVDECISKYDASGSLRWTRQIGSSARDSCKDVSADGLGNVYLSGHTVGNLEGTNAGGADAFISKYDASGSREWTRQLGTIANDWSWAVSADGRGNVYISGYTQGNLGDANSGEFDAFISKYDASGTLKWTRLLGTSSADASWGISADGLGNVYISGETWGSLEGTNAGEVDAFISKYDASGALKWTRQFGTSSSEVSTGVAADGRLGNIYISGYSTGSLEGTNAGLEDAFISKYDASGTLKWTRQIGTAGFDRSLGVSSDRLGNVYISGYTQGSLGGTNAGDRDAFVAKITTGAPESGSHHINRKLFSSINIAPVITIEKGTVGVVQSFVGNRPIADKETGAKAGRRRLVDSGQRGIWREPLLEGKHSLNTDDIRITKVSTQKQIVHYKAGQGKRAGGSVENEIMVRTSDGYTLPVDVQVEYEIHANDTPLLVAMVGDDKKGLRAIMNSAVRAIFRNNSEGVKAVDYIQQRSIQESQSLKMLREEMTKIGVTITGVQIGDIGDEATLGTLHGIKK